MKKIVAAVAVVAIGLAAVPASAQEVLNAFGAKGTLAIDAQGGVQLFDPLTNDGQVGLTPFLGWQFRKQTQPNDPTRDTHTDHQSAFYLNPGADYFVIDHLSIGGEVLLAFTSSSRTTHQFRNGLDVTQDGTSGTHLGIMPRVGYDIPLSSLFSVWPRGGIGYQSGSFSTPVGGVNIDSSSSVWFLFADVPFLLHPAEHFFIGAGPGVTVSLSHTIKSGGISQDGPSILDFRILSTTLGGYF